MALVCDSLAMEWRKVTNFAGEIMNHEPDFVRHSFYFSCELKVAGEIAALTIILCVFQRCRYEAMIRCLPDEANSDES